MKADTKAIRCAIYTRKSSEEGLEQSFNSLDAQREACEAYILSQRHEGWQPSRTRYDDGGYSGGNIDRPALKRLLEDVNAGKVETIVVYKVDRLTRSLADFAKIVEALDARGVSFVSVTQQFNTTTSMGRLTLNVLLSFAQFEREVTGERIRDKIAASKKKGMWMGGFVPLGYDLEQRTLVPNREEANLVRRISALYLELGCVSQLKKRLDREGINSKVRVAHGGARSGGKQFSRGALYELLRNRLYVGEVRHRTSWYPGQHEAIVPKEVFDAVQTKLSCHCQGRRNGVQGHSESLLVGLLWDDQGNRFTPSHTVKSGMRYRYYVCQSAIRDGNKQSDGPVRLPAYEIERLVLARLHSFLRSERAVYDQLSRPDDVPAVLQKLVRAAQNLSARWNSIEPAELHRVVRGAVHRVIVYDTSIRLTLSESGLRQILLGKEPNESSAREAHLVDLQVDASLRRCGMEVRLTVPPGSSNDAALRPSPTLLKALGRAHQWYNWAIEGRVKDITDIAERAGLNDRYVAKVFRCAFLAPDIVEAILDGRQPPELTFRKLVRDLPLSWAEQRHQLRIS
jgi:site-specific DNA recombinase